MLISEAYREQNRLLHEQRDDYGRSGAAWAGYIDKLMREECHADLLDYGCGKGELAAALSVRNYRISEYDPSIPGKDGAPEPADLVTCTDVLEHIEPRSLSSVLADLARVTRRKLFLNISTLPAAKCLPDGRNAHLIVKPAEWWRKRIAARLEVTKWEAHPGFVFGEAAPRGLIRKGTARRPVPPVFAAHVEALQAEINRCNSRFTQVKTVSHWEAYDDKSADMQVVCEILENLPDVHTALAEIAKLARRVVYFIIKLDERRDAEWWRGTLAKRFRIDQFNTALPGRVECLASPAVLVGGLVVKAPLQSEDRWAQIEAASKRVAKRIEPAGAHGRVAILACYGPSLKDSIEVLAEAGKNPNCDVVSVSGAHDFLLEHGIKPRYHVECDPRAHKALNLSGAHQDVAYLVSSSCHSDYFDRLGPDADIRLWHCSTKDHLDKLVNGLREPGNTIISGGGSVGLRSIPLLYELGYREFWVFAMDCSFAENGAQWAGKHAGEKQDCMQINVGGRTFTTSPVLMSYAANFFETMQTAEDITFHMYGDGMLQHMCRLHAQQAEAA